MLKVDIGCFALFNFVQSCGVWLSCVPLDSLCNSSVESWCFQYGQWL